MAQLPTLDRSTRCATTRGTVGGITFLPSLVARRMILKNVIQFDIGFSIEQNSIFPCMFTVR